MEKIYEFWIGRALIAKYRDKSEESAQIRFASEFPEWADDPVLKMTVRDPAY